MANKPSLNLDRINEGDSIAVTKYYDGSGKLCSNGSTMFGVLHEGTEKNFFVHDDVDTKPVIEHLNNMLLNASVKISSNRGGGYSINEKTAQAANNINAIDKDVNIKWGMAFNNATRLVSSIPLHSDEGDIQARVKLIAAIMPEMFKIACSMPNAKSLDQGDVPF